MQDLAERKQLLRERIAELSKELSFHDAAAKGLRERIVNLEDDVRDILDRQREAESKKKGSNKQ